jgi:single-strand DNA-binding protein
MVLLFNKTFCELTIQGRVGSDIELRTSAKGTAYTSFSIAYNVNVKSEDAWVEEARWVRIPLFGKTAEHASKYINKGDLVLVKGSISLNKNADDKWDWKIHVRTITPIFSSNNTNSSKVVESNRTQSTTQEWEDDSLDSLQWDL